MNPDIGNQIPSSSYLTAKGVPQSSPLESKQTEQARMLTSPSRAVVETGSSTNPVSHLSSWRSSLMVRSNSSLMMRMKICLPPKRPDKVIKQKRLSLSRRSLLHSMSSLSSWTRVRKGLELLDESSKRDGKGAMRGLVDTDLLRQLGGGNTVSRIIAFVLTLTSRMLWQLWSEQTRA